MALLGAHMSVAGGLHKAVERGHRLRCETIQIFTRSNVAWHARDLSAEDVQKFCKAKECAGIAPVAAHNCYLINICSAEPATYERSMAALTDEVRRADALGLPYLIMHPGSHGGQGEGAGLRRIAESLSEIHRRTEGAKVMVLLETTAGMGSALGYRFEQIKEIMDRTGDGRRRLGVCFDTCHAFAAGYDLRTRRDCETVFAEFDRVIGLAYLMVFHLNDSKGGLGSRLDRHEHIGRGALGLEPFRFLVTDPRFARHPMYLETPKGKGDYWDRRNLATLRRLCLVSGSLPARSESQ